RNVILIMTTNAGAREMSDASMGFGNNSGAKGKGRGAIERTFTPEFRNRLDAWIAFEPLSFETTERVVDKFIDELRVQLRAKNVTLELTEPARAWLAKNGYDRAFGARPMARLIHSKTKEPLVDAIVFDELHVGRSLRKSQRRSAFTYSIDRAFEEVIASCAESTRGDDIGTWIGPEIIAAYTEFHRAGDAHSVEVWSGDELVVGLYGVD